MRGMRGMRGMRIVTNDFGNCLVLVTLTRR